MNERSPEGVHFDLRVGVNTGEVLAGAVGEAYTVVGDTVKRGRPPPERGSPRQRDRRRAHDAATSAAVAYEDLAPLTLKGKAEPVPAWEALCVTEELPLRRAASGRESPLVGRADELATLGALFERVTRERSPHLITLLGEAGVGKSRILREFERGLAARPDAPAFYTVAACPTSAASSLALGDVTGPAVGRDTDTARRPGTSCSRTARSDE